MAKSRRRTIASVIKSMDKDKPDYIKVRDDVVLKKGQYLNLESKAYQLASLDAAVAAGKLSEAGAAMARERMNKIPDFVRFEIVMVEKAE